MAVAAADLARYRAQLECRSARLERVFPACMEEALSVLQPSAVDAYLQAGRAIGRMGRGVEPLLVFLEEVPAVVQEVGEEAIPMIRDCTLELSRSPNAEAIVPFLQTLAVAARRLKDLTLFSRYLQLVLRLMRETTPRVHGGVSPPMFASPCLRTFLTSVPVLLAHLPIAGLEAWTEFGIRAFAQDPDGQRDYFSLQSREAHTMLQRQRHGVLLIDVERRLSLYLRGLWCLEMKFRPFSLRFDQLRKPKPYLEGCVIHLPDVYEDSETAVSGMDRYRALVAHIAAHRRWTTPIAADNLSPFQRLASEVFEDARVEHLAMRDYPGLRNLWLRLHPTPREGACPQGASDFFHRLSILSRALLDPDHAYTDSIVLDFVSRFRARMAGETSTQDAADLGVAYYAASGKESDYATEIFQEDIEVEYRDDNRCMWFFIEQDLRDTMPATGEGVEAPAEKPKAARPPRHYSEWDYRIGAYRPDWVSVYECGYPVASPSRIDNLLEHHAALRRKLRVLVDMLKPRARTRIRYQEEGSEFDLDMAIRALIDMRCGSTPDPRIYQRYRSHDRSIAVLLLLDLSKSIQAVPEKGGKSILTLEQEAVALLAWAIEKIGDPFAIAGFHSNTRHELRYYRLKDFEENWSDDVKGRLAAMSGRWSTRMGAAMRHAGDDLKGLRTARKLLLLLTDGRPHDVDEKDERLLLLDARKAVQELERDGIQTWGINLDPEADRYAADIFGGRYTVIDRIERLPERLPELFATLTK